MPVPPAPLDPFLRASLVTCDEFALPAVLERRAQSILRLLKTEPRKKAADLAQKALAELIPRIGHADDLLDLAEAWVSMMSALEHAPSRQEAVVAVEDLLVDLQPSANAALAQYHAQQQVPKSRPHRRRPNHQGAPTSTTSWTERRLRRMAAAERRSRYKVARRQRLNAVPWGAPLPPDLRSF